MFKFLFLLISVVSFILIVFFYREYNRKKKIKIIKNLAKKRKIVFASREKVEYLDIYVKDVLSVIARHAGNSRIANAYVSDESSLGDFFARRTDEEYEDAVVNIGEELGVDLDINKPETLYIAEIARKMAHG